MKTSYRLRFHCRFSKWAPAVAALVVTLGATHAAAQEAYPTKPPRFVAPFPPGGTTDVLARVLAQKLGDVLGRQVIVENRPGAAGNIGHEFAAKAAPDGYTLLMTNSSALVINPHLYKRLGFDPLNDFSPVTMVAAGGQVFVVHPSVPARSVKELIALARATPGRMTYGSGGKGTPAHFSGEVFKAATGIKIIHVPYKGTIQSVTDLVAGQIDMVLSDMVPAVPQVNAGRLRALAVSSEQRSQALPNVPTLAEAGVNLTIPQTWWAVVMPKGTPAAIVNRLNGELAKILKLRDVQERYASLGIFTVHTTPEKVLEQIRSESPQVAKVLKAAGVEPE
jgi:tripartite-type tricarboxylate transporter receptor subunit TctC